jgi:hypothetical protein
MAIKHGQNHQLGQPFDASTFEGHVAGVGISFHAAENLVRVWYVSDMANFVLATYVCEWNCRDLELAECEEIVRSLRFDDPAGRTHRH